MPVSKSKRGKKYNPKKEIRLPAYYTEEEKQRWHEKLTSIALFVECTLPSGHATREQVDWIEDMLIWSISIVYKRKEKLDEEEVMDVMPVLIEGKRAITQVIDRKLTKNSTAFVATGDELESNQRRLCDRF